MGADVLDDLVRMYDGLGLEHHRRGRNLYQGVERLDHGVSFGQVLAARALAFPDERDGIDPQDFDADIGQEQASRRPLR